MWRGLKGEGELGCYTVNALTGHKHALTTMYSNMVWGKQVGNERGMHLERRAVMIYHSFSQKVLKTCHGLNKVGETSNATKLTKPSGVDFPHIVVFDFAQDDQLGRVAVGRS